MFKDIKVGGQPNTITVMAQAIWNEDRGCWEIDIVQSATTHSFMGEKYTFTQKVAHVDVEDVDELAIADALLHSNGIDVKKLYQIPYNPILKSE